MSNNSHTFSPRAGMAATVPADGLVIRLARPDDAVALGRLAALDSQRPPAGAVLLAEVGGELWAAAPLGGGPALGDPFRPTSELVELLRIRAGQLRADVAPTRRRLRPRALLGLAARARA